MNASALWALRKLADVCESVDYGFTASAKTSPPGPKFLRITDIVPGHIDWSSVPYCDLGSINVERFRLHDNDIVVARTGATTGVSSIVQQPPESIFASYLVRLRVRDDHDPRFVAYAMKGPSFWEYIRGVLGDKSAQPNASATTLAQAPIPVPPLSEQRAIAAVLGTLDEKIEVNRRMARTLEAAARALFESWFVHFEYPGGNGTARRLLDSRMGPVPEGWSVATLRDVAKERRDGVAADAMDGSMHYIALEHMPRRSIALADWSDAEDVVSNKLRFDTGDILFGKLRPYFHKVGVAPVAGICSTDMVVAQPVTPEWFGFVLGVMSSMDFVAHTDRGSAGTKMPRTNWTDMGAYRVTKPPVELAARFTVLIRPLIDRIIAGIHENRSLSAIRDALLPKLVSGELAVSEVVGRAD